MFSSISEIMCIDCAGKEVSIRGWVHRTRSGGKIVFSTIRDHTGIIQVTTKKGNLPDEQFDNALKMLVESSVEITGIVKEDVRSPGGYELLVSNFNVLAFAEPYPIQKDQSEEWLREKRHLWIRSRRMMAILKIRSTLTGAIHDFFRELGYYEFTPPIFTPNACEGGSTLFEVKYYEQKVYLTQTWQLYAEAMIFSLEKIYDVSPTFRSEKSKTSRHLTEFWMAEMEAAWLTYHDVIKIAKDELKFIIRRVLERNRPDLELLEVNTAKLEAMLDKEWPTITYTEALKLLKEKSGMDVVWGKDLRTAEEEEIMKHFDTPVAVTEYPKEVMAFYKPTKEGGDAPGPVAKCFDMLAPDGGLEIVGGSERDTDINALIKALEAEGENVANYDWYLDLRRYGSVVHSGYGLGVERVLQWMLGLENIKDAIPFPRTMTRVTP
ncbi:MAG: asparagine--tRNA ligase [Candidatus Thermoplasmatota archaeon]|nr:asparagine--tRNA ligase [Euryarchaeota archaeon]MBU4032341.1 asparagine--tRNA ligase [Candidatus Thermoplasmatota archaeon]MBU4071744.1 asparagine--tRNA ligase [Candidatus Thermoplasmatota archaeon]MBU4144838.1 asparagine--tRNA ligase [Candidatus Thermoplasmatota archaeon]MBU4592151.1 asparagine--tRNA ligase [Candidatus Thermoplasmatota archaeon]